MESLPIRIGLVGNVNSGKSSFIGVMTKLDGEYDDGRGYARSKLETFKHEQDTGNTSSIAKTHTIINDKTVEFIDLAGHKRYLKTTVSGLCGHQLDYVFLLVAANDGFIGTSEEHFKIVMGLKIPLAVLITKIDMAPTKKIKETLNQIKDFIRKKSKRHVWVVSDPISIVPPDDMIPLFMISNKTGQGFDKIDTFINKIPQQIWYNNNSDLKKFWIHRLYSVAGIGKVLYGINIQAPIIKGDNLFLGPNKLGEFTKVKVRSVHDDDRNEISELPTQMTGCLALRIKDKEFRVSRGMILLSNTESTKEEGVYTKFECKILMYHHSTIVRPGFTSVMHTGTVRQSVELISLVNQKRPDKDYLATGDYGKGIFKFTQKPEYIKIGRRFMLRDHKILGIGLICELLE